jgi:N6-adenosine-specific RNA methylase IME4
MSKTFSLALSGRVLPVGWDPPADLSEAEWRAVGAGLSRAERSIMWWLGDWLRYGEARQWGEKYTAAVELGFDYGVAADAKMVAERISFSRRREKLSWGHHRAVASIKDDELLAELLAQAEHEGWSVAVLRQHVRHCKTGYAQVKGPSGVGCGFEELHKLVASGVRLGNIYADPPWLYDNQSTRAATGNHYDGMTVDQLCDPSLMPVLQFAAPDAHLHLWTTNGFLFETPRIFEAWGFKFKSSFVWVKPEIGLGNYWRNAHEFLLTGVRGKAEHFDDHNLRSWLECSRGRHSDKPDWVRDAIARASPTPRIELFARTEHEGWLSWGNQIEKNLFSERVNEVA